MYFKSKKISLLILGMTAIILSGMLLSFFNDPEGPNLLVSLGLALIVFFLSLVTYLFDPISSLELVLEKQPDPVGISMLQYLSFVHFVGLKRVVFTVFIQVLIVIVLYFVLR